VSGQQTAVADGARSLRLPPNATWLALLAIPTCFLVVFFVVPLVEMAQESVKAPDFESYRSLTDGPLYGRVLLTTFKTAALITGLCLLIGYPYAYLMHLSRPKARALLLALVLVPFWTSVLVRSFSWLTLLQDTGVINSALQSMGIIDQPISLVRNLLGVTVGMTQILLPYMVLPLYAAMRRIDPGLVGAAQTLGASPARAFRRIFVPLSMPGVVAGVVLVFSLSVGFYITPQLLGGPSDILVGQLIVQKFSAQLDFGTGSALAMVLLAITLLLLALGSRLVKFTSFIDPGAS
jgi:putative spermidine/putrescine transport system permease protein